MKAADLASSKPLVHNLKTQSLRLAFLLFGVGCLLALVFAAGQATTALAQTPAPPGPQPNAEGQALFQSKCSGCHSIGAGKLVGPDLADVTKRRDLQWIKSFISDPNQLFATDATAQTLLQQFTLKMPNLGLSAAEVDALAAYLSNPGSGTAAAGGQTPALAGNSVRGQQYFSGEKALGGGGPSCISCHTVSGVGQLGGGGLGPDLTHALTRLSEPGLTAALQTIAFPTMLGPFTNHALAPQEVADLVAFLKQADKQPAVAAIIPGTVTANVGIIFGISLAGALVLFGVMLFFWPRQRESISSRLRNGRRIDLRNASPKVKRTQSS